MTVRIGPRTFWFFLTVLGERPSSPLASQSPHQAGNNLMYSASVTGRLRCRENRVRFPSHSGAGFSETLAQAEPFDVG
jgi:hypothetical protein